MDMFELVGKRLRVYTKEGREIGLGTYLWQGEVLLDTGKKIHADHCVWKIAPPSMVPPFWIVFKNNVRMFEGQGRMLRRTCMCCAVGERVQIMSVDACFWNHGMYVAGNFLSDSQSRYVLMSEVQLPQVTPHLALVS